MKWYPWLNAPYRQILSCYQQGRGHHALLLHSQPGNGEASLCYAINRWLMCRQPNDSKSCGVCYSCRLMMAGNHPDFYQPEPKEQTLGVDSIRTIIDSVYGRTRQRGRKVVSLPHAEQLTEQAANALLKTLEEPPEDTYFLLVCKKPARLLPTLRSRCLYWPLLAPNEALGLYWLGQAGFDDTLSACTALRLCANAPLAAEALLQPARWQTRLALCTALQDALANGDFLTLLPALNRDKDDEPLHWLLSLLTDALKWQQSAQEYLVNADRTSLVTALAARGSAGVLHAQWQQWLLCLRQCQEISGVNRELLLTQHLLDWEKGVAHTYTFQ
ncbi:MAG: DNA polymerase III subunit delta' [Sodalis sp.]|uniref:DNA polymerase III subunit delta' n=1 Tax=Sodalis sp. (in: enterobacteria) TaxID=1898979 RepID=UPI003872C302|nr:MAG: DNA polymerase III subunit delta' [Sodalis sp.]